MERQTTSDDMNASTHPARRHTAAFLSTKAAMVIAALIAASLVLAQFWYDARHSRDPAGLKLLHRDSAKAADQAGEALPNSPPAPVSN
jgi:hypothetical protein